MFIKGVSLLKITTMIKKLPFIIFILFCFNKSIAQTHIYKFNGVFTESGAIGPTLTEIFDVTCGAPPSGTAGSFGSQTITTSACSRGPQQVFVYNPNSGLSYANTTFIAGTYTIHILYEVDDYTLGSFGFQRVIEFQNSVSDDGLYTRDAGAGLGTLTYAIGGTPTNITSSLVPNQSYLITLVRDGGTNLLDIYLDGAIVLTGYNDVAGVFASAGNPINFFRDDLTVGCETSSGSVRYISISNAISDATQVQATWINICNGVLQSNFISFNAQKNNIDAILQWKTGNESNTSYFEIERSYNGQTYTAISKVNAKQGTTNSYVYTDKAVFSSANINAFYRLKTVDVNGSYEYSAVVKLSNGKSSKIIVFPNPATDAISISGLNNTDIIRLISMDGKILKQQNAGAESVIMHIEKYQSGTYIIQIQNDKEVTQQKFVKR